MKRLTYPTGIIGGDIVAEQLQPIVDALPMATPAMDVLNRSAILVHSAPGGSAVVFESSDGDVHIDGDRIMSIVNNHNQMIQELAAGYGGLEKMPLGAWPPILDQHENDSNDRIIGRLSSLLRFETRDVPGVGQKCACVVADITFLGEDTVKRVLDGRIYHLSIGLHEDSDTLGETSAVIKPAAPGAMLLKKGKKTITKTLQEGVLTMPEIKKLKAHQTSKMAKLKSIGEEFKTLSAKLVSTSSTAKLARRKGEVMMKLSGMMKAGKLTPAEYKKMDIKKMAALDDGSLEVVMSAIDSMEPKVLAGQTGTKDAVEFSTMATSLKEAEVKRMKSEIRKDLKKLGAKVKEDEKEENPKKDMAGEEAEKDKKKLSDSYCDESTKEMSADEAPSEEAVKSMEELQKQVDELTTQMARLAGMLESVMSEEEEVSQELEGHEEDDKEKDLGADEKDKSELGADDKADDKKDMGDKEEGDEKKKDLESDDKKDDDKKDMSEEEKSAKDEVKKDMGADDKKDDKSDLEGEDDDSEMSGEEKEKSELKKKMKGLSKKTNKPKVKK